MDIIHNIWHILEDGRYHDMVMTHNEGQDKYYVDGVLVSSEVTKNS